MIRPHKKNILIYPVPLNQERVTAGGIHMPDSSMYYHDKPRWGTVIAIGSEVKQVKPADVVIIIEGCGVLVKLENDYGLKDEFMFCTEDHLLAVLENPEPEEAKCAN